jgi:hypothetical protein
MRLRALLLLSGAILIAGGFGVWHWRQCEQSAARRLAAWEQQRQIDATEAALDREFDFVTRTVPLTEFANLIAKTSGLAVDIDEPAIAAEKKDIAKISIGVPEGRFSLAAVLGLCLAPHDLGYDIDRSRLVITSRVAAEDFGRMRTVVYPLPQPDMASARIDEHVWHDILVTTVGPEIWTDVGGTGHCQPVPGALVITQSDDMHREIRKVLRALNQLKSPPNSLLPLPIHPIHSRDDEIQAALRRPASLNCQGQPLDVLLAELCREHKVPLVISYRKLAEAGVERETPITLNVEGVSLLAVLQSVLSDLELTYTVRDGTLVITTPEDAEAPENMRSVAYPIHDLTGLPATRRTGGLRDMPVPLGYDCETLVQLIQATVSPESWVDVGGPGSCEIAFDGWLLVSQTADVHRRFETALAQLRRGLSYDGHPGMLPLDSPTPNEVRLEDVLDQPIALRFKRQPLKAALDRLADDLDVSLVYNVKRIEEAGGNTDSLVFCDWPPAPLRDQLQRLLEPLNLAVISRDNVLQVTSVEDAESNLAIRLYDVRPLIDADLGFASLNGLIAELLTRIEPDSWSDQGGPGSIIHFRGLLIVTQSQRLQRKVREFLAAAEEHGILGAPGENPPREDKQ